MAAETNVSGDKGVREKGGKAKKYIAINKGAFRATFQSCKLK